MIWKRRRSMLSNQDYRFPILFTFYFHVAESDQSTNNNNKWISYAYWIGNYVPILALIVPSDEIPTMSQTKDNEFIPEYIHCEQTEWPQETRQKAPLCVMHLHICCPIRWCDCRTCLPCTKNSISLIYHYFGMVVIEFIIPFGRQNRY